MRSMKTKRWATRTAWLAACALISAMPATGADEQPSRLGRLFRFGAASEPSKPSVPSASPSLVGSPMSGSPMSGSASGLGSGTSFSNGSTSAPSSRSVAEGYGQPALSTPPAGSNSLTPTPRISPKPRVNKAVTEADPLVTRISIGHADGGSQFGMFMQVFADGTVIDGGGVHKISSESLKPVLEAVSSGDFAKIKGHCGGPAGDTFENIHVVTYERAYGKLRANAFSYSGNPQGCDHAVHHLHKVLEELQLKLDAPAGAVGTSAATTTPVVVNPPMTPASPAAALSSAATASSAPLGMPSLPDPGLHE